MVQVTLNTPVPSAVPTNGWKVGYRIKGTTGAYIVPVGSPYMTMPAVFTTTDPAGTLYEGYIKRDCGALLSTDFLWETACTCTGTGYVVNELGTGCKKTDTIAATVVRSAYCLAPSTNNVYSQYGARIYNMGYTNSSLFLIAGTTGGDIYTNLSASPQWANPSGNTTDGPMNRDSVWIDNNCDGNRDALTIQSGALTIGATYTIASYHAGDDFTNVGALSNADGVSFTATGTTPAVWTHATVVNIYQTTIGFNYNNTGAARNIYIGVGGDNQFKVQVNGVVVADTGTIFDNIQFKMWHILPVPMKVGLNYFNVVAIGDGSLNDAIAMVLYDNTAAQIAAPGVTDATLNILYRTSSLRCQGTAIAANTCPKIDIATCPATYSLDTSGGSGSYVCRKVSNKVCNSAG